MRSRAILSGPSLFTKADAPEAQKEGSQTCNVWKEANRGLRSEGAPELLSTSSTRKTYGRESQTLHVWLPSRCHPAAESNHQTASQLVALSDAGSVALKSSRKRRT